MAQKWLKCEIGKGMFSDERVVTFSTLDGTVVSFFVPKSFIQSNQVRVRVYNDQAGQPWAEIPDENRSAVPVSEKDLVAS
jgi:hypothetical protein